MESVPSIATNQPKHIRVTGPSWPSIPRFVSRFDLPESRPSVLLFAVPPSSSNDDRTNDDPTKDDPTNDNPTVESYVDRCLNVTNSAVSIVQEGAASRSEGDDSSTSPPCAKPKPDDGNAPKIEKEKKEKVKSKVAVTHTRRTPEILPIAPAMRSRRLPDDKRSCRALTGGNALP
jgi:hypothetical protein